jgi:hypothetical protein
MFQANKGEARWMIVQYEEITSAGVYPWHRSEFGGPSSRSRGTLATRRRSGCRSCRRRSPGNRRKKRKSDYRLTPRCSLSAVAT